MAGTVELLALPRAPRLPRRGQRVAKTRGLREGGAEGFWRRPEEGSAYVVTLMVLLVLTILGLSLSAITQTESLVGSADRQIQRIFYAADSGVGVATAKMLVRNDRRGGTFSVQETRTLLGQDALDISDDVVMSPMVLLLQAPCNLCQINQGSSFFKINNALVVQATRRGIPTAGGDAVPLGRKTLSVMIEVQPSKEDTENMAVLVDDPGSLKQLIGPEGFPKGL